MALRQLTFQSARVMSRMLQMTSARCYSDVTSDFEAAKKKLNELSEDPGNQTKLELYALFKQATVGQCTGKRPGMTDFVGRAKWDAWNALGALNKEDAQKKYISVVNGLASQEKSSIPVSDSSAPGDPVGGSLGDVYATQRGKMTVITLNRPQKKNALKTETYVEITRLLEEAAKDNSSICVLTGTGDYYCSGNDLANFQVDPSTMKEVAERGKAVLQNFVGAFIDFPKPLIAVLNGPAVGISVTTLGLCDAVFATERATFNTPFPSLGQTMEGCSSYTFPRIMGTTAACEMLMFNRKVTALEAKARGLVTEVFRDDIFQREVWERVEAISQLPPNSLKLNKGLVRNLDRKALHEVNKAECEQLCQCWQSEECMTAIMNFFSKKK